MCSPCSCLMWAIDSTYNIALIHVEPLVKTHMRSAMPIVVVMEQHAILMTLNSYIKFCY